MDAYEVIFKETTRRKQTIEAHKYAVGNAFITFYDASNKPVYEVAKDSVLSVQKVKPE